MTDYNSLKEQMRRQGLDEQADQFFDQASHPRTVPKAFKEKLEKPAVLMQGTGGYVYERIDADTYKIVKSPRGKGGQVVTATSNPSAFEAIQNDVAHVATMKSRGVWDEKMGAPDVEKPARRKKAATPSAAPAPAPATAPSPAASTFSMFEPEQDTDARAILSRRMGVPEGVVLSAAGIPVVSPASAQPEKSEKDIADSIVALGKSLFTSSPERRARMRQEVYNAAAGVSGSIGVGGAPKKAPSAQSFGPQDEVVGIGQALMDFGRALTTASPELKASMRRDTYAAASNVAGSMGLKSKK